MFVMNMTNIIRTYSQTFNETRPLSSTREAKDFNNIVPS